MVRLFSLSLLAFFVGTALAEQQVLGDTSVQFNGWSYEDCGENTPSRPKQMPDE